MQNWTETLAYPVVIEGRHEWEQDWTTVDTIATQADFEYRIDSFYYPVLFPLMRLRDAQGQVMTVTQQQLLDYDKKAKARVLSETSPLSAFMKSSPAQAMETAQELVQAGIAAKRFLILPSSKVILGHEALYAVQLHEFENSVVCKILVSDKQAHEAECSVTVWKTERLVDNEPTWFSMTPDNLPHAVVSFLCLLTATIVRDFWVMEEKSVARAYTRRKEKTRKREGTGKERRLVVEKKYIYLPRCAYQLATDRAQTQISREVRVRLSPHLVCGHLRKLQTGFNASVEALARAAEYGLQVGEGYTFVRPHRKGEIEQMRTYRSRSAFELLFKG